MGRSGTWLQWMLKEQEWQGEDGVLQKTAYSFDASVWELFMPLLSGARLVMAEPGGERDARLPGGGSAAA